MNTSKTNIKPAPIVFDKIQMKDIAITVRKEEKKYIFDISNVSSGKELPLSYSTPPVTLGWTVLNGTGQNKTYPNTFQYSANATNKPYPENVGNKLPFKRVEQYFEWESQIHEKFLTFLKGVPNEVRETNLVLDSWLTEVDKPAQQQNFEKFKKSVSFGLRNESDGALASIFKRPSFINNRYNTATVYFPNDPMEEALRSQGKIFLPPKFVDRMCQPIYVEDWSKPTIVNGDVAVLSGTKTIRFDEKGFGYKSFLERVQLVVKKPMNTQTYDYGETFNMGEEN